jgi:hypothetical protein
MLLRPSLRTQMGTYLLTLWIESFEAGPERNVLKTIRTGSFIEF